MIEVGANVSKFKVGDDVFGITLFGGYSKKVQVPERQIRLIPENMTTSQAAGFPIVALTAWYAMMESCKLRKSDRILIHSVAGGVGSMMLQIGKILGCHVTGVVGKSSKIQFAKDLGTVYLHSCIDINLCIKKPAFYILVIGVEEFLSTPVTIFNTIRNPILKC